MVDHPEIDDEQSHHHESSQAQVGEGHVRGCEARSIQVEAESLVHEGRQGEDQVLHEEPESEGHEGDIEIAESNAQEPDNDAHGKGDETAGDDGGQHRPPMVVG